MTKLYIDADACPVKSEAERVATRHRVQMFVVSNGGLRPSQNPLVETVIVPEGPDIADMWIADRAGPGDVVVTGDIPLAAKCVEAGARVLKHNGEALTAANIGNVLATRDLMADLRAASLETLLQMVAAGFGCTLLPALALRSDWAKKKSVMARKLELSDTYRRVSLVHRRTFPRRQAIEVFKGKQLVSQYQVILKNQSNKIFFMNREKKSTQGKSEQRDAI